MASPAIVAQFIDYSAAHHTLCELIQTGIWPTDISIIAGDRSNSRGTYRDFGILEGDTERYLWAVHHGETFPMVAPNAAARSQVLKIIEHHMPIEIQEIAAAEMMDASLGAEAGASAV